MRNILQILMKEFKLNIRNFKANSMMVLFPIVLIIILGAAFSSAFNSTIKLDTIKVLYTEDASGSSHYLTNAFKGFRESLTEEYGLVFEKTDDVNAGMESVKGYEYTGYVLVSDNTGEIKLYKNTKYGGYKTIILESALNSFTKLYKAGAAVKMSAPQVPDTIVSENHGSFVDLKSLNGRKQAGAMDYYSITMLTMILLYASLTGFWGVREDMEQMTAGRTLCAPVRRYEFLTGKVLGCILVTVVQALVVVLTSKFVLKAYWGENLLPVLLIVLTYAVMAVSLGVGLAYIIKNGNAASGILNTVIPILVFLGGGYVPLSVMGDSISAFTNISPVKWANSALFKIIYDSDYSQMTTSVMINLAIAAVFILLSAMLSRKGTGKYA